MNLNQLAKQLASDVGAVLKKYLGDFRKEFETKLADQQTAVENRFASLPEPEPGPKGDKGDDAQLDMDAVKQILLDAVAALELPKGEKGDAGEVDIEALKEMIAAQVAKIELPIPEKGDKGDAGTVDMEEIKRLLQDAVKAIEMPEPKSAVDIEIEDGIDAEKVYPRGSYARHRGGLWRSFERTKGMKGWECIVVGIAKIEVDYDGRRTATITIAKSDGEDEVKTIKIPALLDAEIWREQDYEKGDVVSFSGAMWIAQKDNPKGRPGQSEDWRLSVKRGGTGKSAFDLARDAGFTGTRMEWLDSLGKKPTVKLPET